MGRKTEHCGEKGASRVIIIVDRFEGDLAVVEYEGGIFTLPRALLPGEAKEGDVLRITIEVDHSATADRRRRIAEKEDRLFRK